MTSEIIKNVKSVMEEMQLNNPTITFLKRDTHDFAVSMIQPKGNLAASAAGIKPKECNGDWVEKFYRFILDAVSKGIDLTVSPEYSCPLAAIIKLIEENKFPKLGTLFALGCESFTLVELNQFKSKIDELRVNLSIDIQVETEPNLLQQTTKNFVSPLLYLFQTTDVLNRAVWVVLIQTKTHPMSDESHFEQDNLFLGNIVYKFENESNSNSLISIICSDSLNSDVSSSIKSNAEDAFILHIQLNANPADGGFRNYRESIQRTNKTTDFLCANWAQKTTINNQVLVVNHPKSIFFTKKSDTKKITDADITKYQAKGCFVANFEDFRSVAFVFAPSEYFFQFSLNKVKQSGSGQGAKKNVLTMSEVFIWEISSWVSANEPIPDGFSQIEGNSESCIDLINTCDQDNRLLAERFIELSTGHFSREKWHVWTSMKSMKLAPDESLMRVTVNWSCGEGKLYQESCYRLFRALEFVATELCNMNLVEQFKPLTTGNAEKTLKKLLDSAYSPTNFHVPVTSNSNSEVVTDFDAFLAIHMDQAPATTTIDRVFTHAYDVLRASGQNKNNLILFFRKPDGSLHYVFGQKRVTECPSISHEGNRRNNIANISPNNAWMTNRVRMS